MNPAEGLLEPNHLLNRLTSSNSTNAHQVPAQTVVQQIGGDQLWHPEPQMFSTLDDSSHLHLRSNALPMQFGNCGPAEVTPSPIDLPQEVLGSHHAYPRRIIGSPEACPLYGANF
ncbi:hypothetical protein R1flu_004868 [Riccia fluitans]|uniref:Uncharacterized protein n=1 Tax=Riccia fluitans TaxID=41844 RepID=A0ABD1YSH9_9MARC